MRQRLILCPPPGLAADTLSDALRAGDVAAVVLAGGGQRLKALVQAAQVEGTAALVLADALAGDAVWPTPAKADGLHLVGDAEEAREALLARPEGATVGVAAADRHDAMMLGESGADYLWFGDVEALDEEAVILAAWWQGLFEVPCVIAGPDDEAMLTAMIASRAEFVATNVFHSADPAERVARINERLDDKAPTP